ncbi:MAG TPA: hypothetical protein VJ385_14065 [Fibrobacteria bacterium]|nr:hypothetical protein [Fibrobacteria bacterium]
MDDVEGMGGKIRVWNDVFFGFCRTFYRCLKYSLRIDLQEFGKPKFSKEIYALMSTAALVLISGKIGAQEGLFEYNLELEEMLGIAFLNLLFLKLAIMAIRKVSALKNERLLDFIFFKLATQIVVLSLLVYAGMSLHSLLNPYRSHVILPAILVVLAMLCFSVLYSLGTVRAVFGSRPGRWNPFYFTLVNAVVLCLQFGFIYCLKKNQEEKDCKTELSAIQVAGSRCTFFFSIGNKMGSDLVILKSFPALIRSASFPGEISLESLAEKEFAEIPSGRSGVIRYASEDSALLRLLNGHLIVVHGEVGYVDLGGEGLSLSGNIRGFNADGGTVNADWALK